MKNAFRQVNFVRTTSQTQLVTPRRALEVLACLSCVSLLVALAWNDSIACAGSFLSPEGFFLAEASGLETTGKPVLPEWPKDFGPSKYVIDGLRHPGYRAVQGPDGYVWCFVLREVRNENGGFSENRRVIGFTQVGPDIQTGGFIELAAPAGEVVDVDVSAGNGAVVVFWAEKVEDEYHLYSRTVYVQAGEGEQAQSDAKNPEVGEPQQKSPSGNQDRDDLAPAAGLHLGKTAHLLMVKSVVTDVAIAVSGQEIIYGWIDQEEGRPGVFLCAVDMKASGDTTGNGVRISKRVRVSSPEVSASILRLSPAPGGAWVTWVQSRDVLYQMMLRAYIDGTLYPEIEVSTTNARETYGLIALTADEDAVHLVFTKGRIFRGEVGKPAVTYGKITREGKWVVGPLSVNRGEGYATSPDISTYGNKMAFVWSDNRTGRLGVYWAEFTDHVFEPLNYGSVTYSSKECLSPAIFPFSDGTKVVLYYECSGESGMLVKGVTSRNPRAPDWRYFLGLDIDRPLQSMVFKAVNALAASLVITCLALPSVAFGVVLTFTAEKLGIFSDTRAGRILKFMFLFGCIFLAKSQGKWFYLFAPLLPVGLSWVSFSIASASSLLLLHHLRTGYAGILPSAVGGTLYVFFDTLFSLVQKGVGYF